jgi:hypothetical protein
VSPPEVRRELQDHLLLLKGDAVKSFIARFGDRITGVLKGFDRLVFRGHMRKLAFVEGMRGLLRKRSVLLKDFGAWAQGMTHRLEEASLRAAQVFDRPIRYLPSAKTDKEAVARKIAHEDGITQGLVAVLTSVELCPRYDIYRNREEKRLQLVRREGKCKFIYHYAIDPELGWMNARIQTWLPFNIQICINGREWLSRQMDREGMTYRRADNCFPWISDLPRAQTLMDEHLRTRWPELLRTIARRLNPDHTKLFPELDLDYYWSVYQSEWASDLLFRDSQSLAEIYPALVRHGITAFSSPDVMRFLGRKLHGNYQGEVVSSLKERTEGVRIKHWVGRNSIKLYDKAGSVLRPETTLQDPRPFKVWRAKEGEPHGLKEWLRMRSGVADLARRAKVSQAANERYLEAYAATDTSTPLGKLVGEISTPVTWKKSRLRGLRPWEKEDLRLLRAANDGKWCVHGFRNRDLQALLFEETPKSDPERRHRSAQVTRLIRLLRAHGLIKKEPRTHRYTVTPHGREIMTAILTAQNVTLEQLRTTAA